MTKNTPQQRRRQILDLLAQTGKVSVEPLAQQLNTSEVTIRKDLATLESSGLLLRRYGGAVAIPQELMSGVDSENISDQKLAIAKAAAGLIRDHNRIIIDSGSTTAALLPELSAKQGLLVMTNSLSVANSLRELENEPTLLMTGGTWDPHSEAFQGQVAEHVLRAYDFDQLFIGADGLDVSRGTTTFNELVGLSRVMADVAREVVVVIESEKLGRKIPNLELAWSSVSTIVSDSDFPAEAKQQLELLGIKVICA